MHAVHADSLSSIFCLCHPVSSAQVNYNLLSVNAFMAVTGAIQLFRKVSHDLASDSPNSMPELQGSGR